MKNKAQVVALFDEQVLAPIYADNVHVKDIVDLWMDFITIKHNLNVISLEQFQDFKHEPFYLLDIDHDEKLDSQKQILEAFRDQVEKAEGKELESMHNVRLENLFYLFKKKLWDTEMMTVATYRKFRGWVHPLRAMTPTPGINDIGRKLMKLAGHPIGFKVNSLKPWQLNVLRRKLGIIKDET